MEHDKLRGNEPVGFRIRATQKLMPHKGLEDSNGFSFSSQRMELSIYTDALANMSTVAGCVSENSSWPFR